MVTSDITTVADRAPPTCTHWLGTSTCSVFQLSILQKPSCICLSTLIGSGEISRNSQWTYRESRARKWGLLGHIKEILCFLWMHLVVTHFCIILWNQHQDALFFSISKLIEFPIYILWSGHQSISWSLLLLSCPVSHPVQTTAAFWSHI